MYVGGTRKVGWITGSKHGIRNSSSVTCTGMEERRCFLVAWVSIQRDNDKFTAGLLLSISPDFIPAQKLLRPCSFCVKPWRLRENKSPISQNLTQSLPILLNPHGLRMKRTWPNIRWSLFSGADPITLSYGFVTEHMTSVLASMVSGDSIWWVLPFSPLSAGIFMRILQQQQQHCFVS